jgi:hypothetical protein
MPHGDHPRWSVLRRPLVAGPLHVASANDHGIGQMPRSTQGSVPVRRRVPGLRHGSRASASAAPRESTRSAGHQGRSRPGQALRSACADRTARRGIRRIRAGVATSLPPAGPHRDGRHHDVGDEFEARAPDGADAQESRTSSRGASDPRDPRSPSHAPTASDRLTCHGHHRLAPRRLQRDATRVGGRSGLADVERPESNTKSRCRERAFRARVRRPFWPGRVGLVRNRLVRSDPVHPVRNASGRKRRFRGPAPRRPVRSGRRPRRDPRHASVGAGDSIGTTGSRKTL